MSAALAIPAAIPEHDPLHTISVLVRNQPGVLVRVALVFARRGYNIESLVVSPDPTDAGFSRMTITSRGAPETLEQMIRQVAKLVDVVHAIDHTGQSAVETEIALIKLQAQVTERTEILQIAEHYKAKVVDCGPIRSSCGSPAAARSSTASSRWYARSAWSSWSGQARS